MPSWRPVCATLNSFHSAEFDQHVGGVLVAAGFLAAHDAGEQFDGPLVGDHAHRFVERVGAPVERQHLLAVLGAAHGEVSRHLGGVEHVQRPAAVEGDVVGDIDQRVDGAKPDGDQPLLQPVRRGAVLDAAHQPQTEGGAKLGRVDLDLDRAGERALHRLRRVFLVVADIGGAEIAGDAVDAGAVGTVGRQVDLDHRIAEIGPFGVSDAHRRIGRQFDDAVMIVGDHQLGFRAQHAVAFDAADGADRERDVLAGDVGAGRREHALHAGLGIGRAAHHLDRLFALGDLADVDHAHAQAVRVRVLLGRDHVGDDERLQQRRLVLDVLDLEPDHGELVDDLVERRRGVEMIFQPGEGEFHALKPPASVGKSSGRNP